MQEPQEPQEPVVPTEPSPQGTTEPIEPQEPQEPTEPQEPVEPPVEPPEPPPEPVKKKYTMKVDGRDEEFEWTDEELLEQARKGVGFTKKTQALSEWEKANQQKLQLADQLMGNPNTVRYLMAQQLGYDPQMVLGNPQAPDPSWREQYPDQYWQQKAYYDTAVTQKQAFDNAFNSIVSLNAQSANSALFEKARIQNNLSDSEYQSVRSYVDQNMRANQAGMYSDAQIQGAIRAVVDRSASEKLETANRVQQTLKKAATSSSPQKQIPQRQEKLSKKEKDEREYNEYVQKFMGQR